MYKLVKWLVHGSLYRDSKQDMLLLEWKKVLIVASITKKKKDLWLKFMDEKCFVTFMSISFIILSLLN